MSFFSNPLAEDDEVVPPDYPLEQYDERKREDDFNELLVRSTKLEAAQRSSGDAAAVAHPDLVQCLKQNQKIRLTLEETWAEISDYDKKRRLSVLSTPSEVPPALSHQDATAALHETLNSVSAKMQAQAVHQESVTRHLHNIVEKASSRLTTAEGPSLVTSPTASPYTVLHTATTVVPHAQSSTARSSNIPTEVPAIEIGEVEDAVRVLEAQLPFMSAEEAALAASAVQHLQYGLRTWTALVQRHAALHQSVAVKTQEQREAHLATQTFARWMASRQLTYKTQTEQNGTLIEAASSSATSLTPAEPPLSFDLALAESLNKELNEENWRLEVVLARLLSRKAGASSSSLAGSALVQYVSLLDHARELEQEVEHLGSAVLYLRAVLADPASAMAQELVRASFPTLTPNTEGDALHSAAPQETVWAARLTHISTLEQSLRSLPAEHGGARNADNAADEILVHSLTKLLELYDVSLHAVALLSTYFEKQSASAAFLTHAMRGGGPLEDATVERILDVQLPDAAAVRQTIEDVAATCAEVKVNVSTSVQEAIAASAATLTRWESVRSLLTRLLHETLLTSEQQRGKDSDSGRKELMAYLAAYSENDRSFVKVNSPVTDCVRAEPSWAAALQEEVEAFKAEKNAKRTQAKEYWLSQQTETNKKLTWLMKQPNAPLLVQLCAAEEAKKELEERLNLERNASAEASELQHTLADLQDQVAKETLHNTRLQEELAEVQTRKHALENERANLIASFS